ncbi:MAG: type II toxin-antitoxin system HicB family antitoxin [Lachnospiraceae bacterium]|jgi:predicted RNase H-like HicB family nuclease|nr:type II toxin-antitoxin system HicB family antitoxin [Lachnospiraceae bacterium]
MKYQYPAVFKQTNDNTYKACFPDLEGCTASGDSLMDVIDEAREAAADWISVELEDPEAVLPFPSEEKDITLQENETVRMITVNVSIVGGWAEYQPVRPV